MSAVLIEATEAALRAVGTNPDAPGSIAEEIMQHAGRGEPARVVWLVQLLHERMEDGEWEEHSLLLQLLKECWGEALDEAVLVRLCREITRHGCGTLRVGLLGSMSTRGVTSGVMSVEEMLDAAERVEGGRR